MAYRTIHTAGLAAAIALQATTAATAQDIYLPATVDRFSERLGEMQGDRLRAYRETRQQLIDGWCERRLANLNSLHAEVERRQAQFSPETLAAYRQALAQERAYPCPPGGPPTPPPPPPPVVAVPSVPVTPSPAPARTGDGGRISTEPSATYDPGPLLPGSASPPAAAPASRPPAPPAQGLTQEDMDEVARQQRRIDDVRRAEREDREARERQLAAGEELPRITLEASGGIGGTRLPQSNFGFVRDSSSAVENPALRGPRSISLLTLATAAYFAGLGRLDLTYAEGDARRTADLPAGPTGSARGFPYTARSPSGSTGVAGNVPLRAETGAEVQQFGGAFRIELVGIGRVIEQQGIDRRPRASVHAGATVSHREQEHRSLLSITTPVVATQALDQRIKELSFGPLIGASVSIPLGDGLRLNAGGDAALIAYDFDLRSTEAVTQNFGPAADRDFTTRIADEEKGVSYAVNGYFEMALSIDPDQQLEAFAGARASYGASARLINPFSGDAVLGGETSRIAREEEFGWAIFAGLRLKFGQRP